MYDDAVSDDKIDDLNEENALHLQDCLVSINNKDNKNNNNINYIRVINQQDKQENHFGATNNNPQT